MIPVIEIFADMRYELGDMHSLNISDNELTASLNKAVRLLYGAMSDRYVYAGVKRKAIEINRGKRYELPPDFLRVHQLLREAEHVQTPTARNPPCVCTYRIVGTELYADAGDYMLEYYYMPSKVRLLDDMLDVPESMQEWIEQIALSYYKKDLGTAVALTEKCCEILACREISHIEDTGPLQILGGRV